MGNCILYYAYVFGQKLDNLNPGIASTLSNLSLIISILLPYFIYNMRIKKINSVGILICETSGTPICAAPLNPPCPALRPPRGLPTAKISGPFLTLSKCPDALPTSVR